MIRLFMQISFALTPSASTPCVGITPGSNPSIDCGACSASRPWVSTCSRSHVADPCRQHGPQPGPHCVQCSGSCRCAIRRQGEAGGGERIEREEQELKGGHADNTLKDYGAPPPLPLTRHELPLQVGLAAPGTANVGYVTLPPAPGGAPPGCRAGVRRPDAEGGSPEGVWGGKGRRRVAGPYASPPPSSNAQSMGTRVIRQGGTVSRTFRWKDWRGVPWQRPSMQARYSILRSSWFASR